MKKTELISRLAEKTGTSKAQAKAAINAFTGIVAEAMAENEPVKIEGFGTFLVKQRAGHIGRNPMHPEKTVKIPPHNYPVFRASRNLKKSINSREAVPANKTQKPCRTNNLRRTESEQHNQSYRAPAPTQHQGEKYVKNHNQPFTR